MPRLGEVRERLLNQPNGRVDVQSHGLTPAGRTHRCHRYGEAVASSVVHEDVQTAEGGDGFADQTLGRRFVRHVCREGDCAAAPRIDRVGCLLNGVRGAGGEHHRASVGCVFLGDGPSDTARGTRDQRDPTSQILSVHAFPFRRCVIERRVRTASACPNAVFPRSGTPA